MTADRTDIEFEAEGVLLRGMFFAAETDSGPAPCVVMAHGWPGEATHFLTDFARIFAAVGIASVVFDHRGWGRSDVAAGKPRRESEPWEQIHDYQHAITYVQNRPDVDPNRIGVWGFSYSAGHAFVLAAIDRRIKAVVGHLPLISGQRRSQRMLHADTQQMQAEFIADRRARARGEAPMVIPVVDKDPLAPSALPTAEAYEYFYGSGGVSQLDPNFSNEITLRSVEYLYGYEPGWYLPRISPTPLLMVVAPKDPLDPNASSLRAYETAAQPKKLVIVPGGHFGALQGTGGDTAQAEARDWFVQHLDVKQPAPWLKFPVMDLSD